MGGKFPACIGWVESNGLALLLNVGPFGMGTKDCKRHNVDTLEIYKRNHDGSLQRDDIALAGVLMVGRIGGLTSA